MNTGMPLLSISFAVDMFRWSSCRQRWEAMQPPTRGLSSMILLKYSCVLHPSSKKIASWFDWIIYPFPDELLLTILIVLPIYILLLIFLNILFPLEFSLQLVIYFLNIYQLLYLLLLHCHIVR